MRELLNNVWVSRALALTSLVSATLSEWQEVPGTGWTAALAGILSQANRIFVRARRLDPDKTPDIRPR